MPTGAFIIINTVLVIGALYFARQGWRTPSLSLVVPAATLVNAVAFHIAPTIISRHVSPGVYTALVLYVPFSTWAIVGAVRDGVRRSAIATGVATGTAMNLSVVLVAWLASR